MARDYTVVVKKPGNLLPNLINREISKEQAELVELLISATDEADDAELEMLGLSLEMAIQYREVTR